MLTKRIIPCLDVDRGRVVKGVNFLNLRDAGDPVEVARRYEEEGADELVFLDISASHEGREILLDVVRRVSEEIFMPFTVGGGIRTLEDATRLIQAGAEKVSINSAAVKTPELVTEVAEKFGRCATVVNIDPRRVQKDGREVWEVHINGGRVGGGVGGGGGGERGGRVGGGGGVVASMGEGGTQGGYDLPMTRAVAEAVGIPVVASGGAGSPEHLYRVLTEGKADEALAASIFHYNEYGIPATKTYLAERGVPVRIVS